MTGANRTDEAFRLPEGNVQIAFSGGRTSAFMLHEILRVNGPLPERVVVSFQNTGREMPQTLDFVQECGERWGVPIVWLEYRAHPPHYEIVGHNSASRNGEPFKAMVVDGVRPYLPNQLSRHCTEELKIRTARRYLVDLGWEHWTAARGIRRDEPSRRKVGKVKGQRFWSWQPLYDAGVTKWDVMAFWGRQPFDLRLEAVEGKTLRGNCDGCFLKSEANLAALARDYPERYAWWEDLERLAQERADTKQGAQFNQSCSRRELREYVERQSDWIFDAEDALCQADGGECVG